MLSISISFVFIYLYNNNNNKTIYIAPFPEVTYLKSSDISTFKVVWVITESEKSVSCDDGS